MWQSVGRVVVPVAGTLVQVVSVALPAPTPATLLVAHSILFQQVKGNLGWIYVFDSPNGNKSTGANLIASLATPTANTCPSASATVMYAPAAFDVGRYWIDVDNSGEGCQVSIIVA